MRIPLVLALLAAALTANAEVYTWTDANGVVHYTDRATGPDSAQVVQGVESAPREARPDAIVKVSAAELQGTWCEYEVASDKSASDGVPKSVQWDFRGSTLKVRDLASGRVIEGQFRVEGARIVTDKAAMASRTVRKFDDDGMHLDDENAYYRLRRGGC
jgi:hypothetical protein